MSLKIRINDDMKAALRAKETARLSAVRLLLAAIKQKEVDERIDPTDADIIAIIEKMIKQRGDSITQYEKGGRPDLADVEKSEIGVLQAYLPQPLTESEVLAAVCAAIQSSGARGVSDMGKVMAALKQQLAGKADMRKVSALVKAQLGG